MQPSGDSQCQPDSYARQPWEARSGDHSHHPRTRGGLQHVWRRERGRRNGCGWRLMRRTNHRSAAACWHRSSGQLRNCTAALKKQLMHAIMHGLLPHDNCHRNSTTLPVHRGGLIALISSCRCRRGMQTSAWYLAQPCRPGSQAYPQTPCHWRHPSGCTWAATWRRASARWCIQAAVGRFSASTCEWTAAPSCGAPLRRFLAALRPPT